MNQRDYSICTENTGGVHDPLRAADDQRYATPGWVEIACDACGTTTGLKIPDGLEWN